MIDKDIYKIINGNNLDVLPTLETNSVDAIITDPPYELGFMGKKWDSSGIAYNVEMWKQAFRVLKSGGYLLAFGGTRTYHRIACAIEDAGFEIRDCIMWLYGSGFPKSMNIGLAIDKRNGVESEIIGTQTKGSSPLAGNHNGSWCDNQKDGIFQIKRATNEWNGWGTQLKPSYEPIIIARKPIEGNIVNNVLKYGVGGINIDECRVPFEETPNPATNPKYRKNAGYKLPEKGQESKGAVSFTSSKNETNDLGRFPANTILTYDDTDFDEVCGGMPNSKSTKNENSDNRLNIGNSMFIDGVHNPNNSYDDEGSACRYFYCAKASRKDRDEGLDLLESKLFYRTRPDADVNKPTGLNKEGRFAPVLRKNIHPTVKPVELMQYLVRLVSPKGATILDIFNGSGSTGKAVAFENRERNANYKYIGIELDAEYCKISESRIDYAVNKYKYDIAEEIKENEKKGQLSLFDLDYE